MSDRQENEEKPVLVIRTQFERAHSSLGSIRLRVASVGVTQELGKMVDAPAEDFLVQALSLQLVDPGDAALKVKALTPAELEELGELALDIEPDLRRYFDESNADSFSECFVAAHRGRQRDFIRSVSKIVQPDLLPDLVASFRFPWEAVSEYMGNQFRTVTEVLQQQHADLASTILEGMNASFTSLFAEFPKPADYQKYRSELDAGEAALAQTDFQWVTDLLALEVLIAIGESPAASKTTSAANRKRSIANRMINIVKAPEFKDSLFDSLHQSKVTTRRIKIFEEAYVNYEEGRLKSSLCLLLPQVEGLMADLSVAGSLIEIRGGKRFGLDPKSGTPKLDKNGKQVEVNGMISLIDHAKYRSDPTFTEPAEYIADHMFPERNMILHGTKVRFGRSMDVALTLLMSARICERMGQFEGPIGI